MKAVKNKIGVCQGEFSYHLNNKTCTWGKSGKYWKPKDQKKIKIKKSHNPTTSGGLGISINKFGGNNLVEALVLKLPFFSSLTGKVGSVDGDYEG